MSRMRVCGSLKTRRTGPVLVTTMVLALTFLTTACSAQMDPDDPNLTPDPPRIEFSAYPGLIECIVDGSGGEEYESAEGVTTQILMYFTVEAPIHPRSATIGVGTVYYDETTVFTLNGDPIIAGEDMSEGVRFEDLAGLRLLADVVYDLREQHPRVVAARVDLSMDSP